MGRLRVAARPAASSGPGNDTVQDNPETRRRSGGAGAH